jgi:hypothetical protein
MVMEVNGTKMHVYANGKLLANVSSIEAEIEYTNEIEEETFIKKYPFKYVVDGVELSVHDTSPFVTLETPNGMWLVQTNQRWLHEKKDRIRMLMDPPKKGDVIFKEDGDFYIWGTDENGGNE